MTPKVRQTNPRVPWVGRIRKLRLQGKLLRPWKDPGRVKIRMRVRSRLRALETAEPAMSVPPNPKWPQRHPTPRNKARPPGNPKPEARTRRHRRRMSHPQNKQPTTDD